jgi:hypothetical protein
MQLIRDHKFITVCVILAVLLVGIVLRTAFAVSPEDIKDREDAIKETVRERALQCYVIENAYPESLSYLEENYGLTVNKEDYLIVYDLFAENQPPTIKVIYQGDKK